MNPLQTLAEKSLQKDFGRFVQEALSVDDRDALVLGTPQAITLEKLSRSVLRALRNRINLALQTEWFFSGCCSDTLEFALTMMGAWQDTRHASKPYPSMAEVLFWVDGKTPSFGLLDKILADLTPKAAWREIHSLFPMLQTESQVACVLAHPVAGPVAARMLDEQPESFVPHPVFRREVLHLARSGKISLLDHLVCGSSPTLPRLTHLMGMIRETGEDLSAPLPAHARHAGKIPLDVLLDELLGYLDSGDVHDLSMTYDVFPPVLFLLESGARPSALCLQKALMVKDAIEEKGGFGSMETLEIHGLGTELANEIIDRWSKVSVKLSALSLETVLPAAAPATGRFPRL
jgi:hypothetical protein